jgi:LysM repeat protein
MRLLINLLVLTVLHQNIEAQDYHVSDNPANDTLEAYVDAKYNTYFQYHSQSETISSDLARQFHVRESEMLSIRTNASQDTMGEIGSILIPFASEDLLKEKSAASDCIAVVYTVRRKETLFKIARRYFDLKVDQLRRINNLSSNAISIDQRLLVGWFVLHPVTESVHTIEPKLTSIALPVDPFYPEDPILQIGVAFWKKSPNESSHLFAMHRSARINSMIEITNPMFNTKVLVKVVGRIPPTYKQDIALVVSPAVAKILGVLDPRFRAEMRFLE